MLKPWRKESFVEGTVVNNADHEMKNSKRRSKCLGPFIR